MEFHNDPFVPRWKYIPVERAGGGDQLPQTVAHRQSRRISPKQSATIKSSSWVLGSDPPFFLLCLAVTLSNIVPCCTVLYCILHSICATRTHTCLLYLTLRRKLSTAAALSLISSASSVSVSLLFYTRFAAVRAGRLKGSSYCSRCRCPGYGTERT